MNKYQMKKIMFIALGLSILYLMPIQSNAQKISFTLTVDKDTIQVGKTVTVTYTLKGARGEFVAPDFGELRLVGGPNYSSSISIVNGAMSQEFTYTYVFQLTEPGDYKIPSAAVKAEGEQFTSPETNVHATENEDWDPSHAIPKRPLKKSKKDKNVTQI